MPMLWLKFDEKILNNRTSENALGGLTAVIVRVNSRQIMINMIFLRKVGCVSLEKGDVETDCRLFETVSRNGPPNFCHRVRGETIL